MAYAASDLDFAVVDRARTLGDLLRLLFAMLEAFGPKDVADLLTEFDGAIVVDPETAGRWLRNERKPSKQHLRLIVRLLQTHGLMGAPQAKDRVFMRIAAFYAKLEVPEPTLDVSDLPNLSPGAGERQLRPGDRFRALREEYELALGLQIDLTLPGEDMPRFEAWRGGRRPLDRYKPAKGAAIQQSMPVTKAVPIWQRFVRGLLALIRTK